MGLYRSGNFETQMAGDTACYEMNDEAAMFMGKMMMAEYGANEGTVNCYFVGPGSMYANLGRTVEQRVFFEKFGNDESEMRSEYAPYEERSSFFITLDPRGLPIGVLRVIGGESPEDFKSLYDVRDERPVDEYPERAHIDLEKFAKTEGIEDFSTVWDIGTIAVPKEYRGAASGQMVSTLLHRALYAGAKQQGIKHFVAIIDSGENGKSGEHQNLNKLGVPFNPILGSEPFEYLGSKNSTALHCRVDDVEMSMVSKAQEYMREAWVATGSGEALPSRRADLNQHLVRLIGNMVFGQEMDDKIHYRRAMHTSLTS